MARAEEYQIRLACSVVSTCVVIRPWEGQESREARGAAVVLLAPCWASGAEPPRVVRVVTGIARVRSVCSEGAERSA